MVDYVALGDSNSTNFAVAANQVYDYLFAANCGLTFQNSAVAGQYAINGPLLSLNTQLMQYGPANVTLMIGTNDAAHAYEVGQAVPPMVAEYVEQLGEIISIAMSVGMQFFLLTPPMSRTPEVNSILVQMIEPLPGLCDATGATFVNVYARMLQDKTNQTLFDQWFITNDPYHLSVTGQSRLYSFLADQIRAKVIAFPQLPAMVGRPFLIGV